MFFSASRRMLLSTNPRISLTNSLFLKVALPPSRPFSNTAILRDTSEAKSETPSTPLGKLTPTRTHIQFTCKVCNHVNKKTMSKKAYTTGLVIIRCDGCANNHLIADHIGWYDSQKSPGTIEDIMREQGKSSEVRRLSLKDGADQEEDVQGMLEIPGPDIKI